MLTASKRPTWDEYGLGLAKAASARGDCTRRQVGAVVMDAHHRIVGAGYNGYPPGVPGCLSDGACPRGQLTYDEAPPSVNYAGTGCTATHAEVNAVRYASAHVDISTCTVYVTDQPCPDCAAYLDAWRVKRVVWPGSFT